MNRVDPHFRAALKLKMWPPEFGLYRLFSGHGAQRRRTISHVHD